MEGETDVTNGSYSKTESKLSVCPIVRNIMGINRFGHTVIYSSMYLEK